MIDDSIDTAAPTLPADSGAPTMPVKQLVLEIELSRLKPSPTNPRKVFKQDELEELAASIASHGVIVPIRVRAARKGDYEIIYGERRWRASKLAKKTSIPCVVVERSDQEAFEDQVLENGQRADVHELEEADAFARLQDKYNYTVEAIAAKFGKTKATVYARLKLRHLKGEQARAAFLEDKINASVALLLARMPVAENQDAGAAGILKGIEEEKWTKEGRQTFTRPMSYREAADYLRENFTLRLDKALFPIADAQLVPAAGACVDCPHNTGNRPDDFPDVDDGDVCTKPPCFAEKKAAHAKIVLAQAKKTGQKILAKTETKELFRARDEDEVSDDGADFEVDEWRARRAGYSPLTEGPGYEHDKQQRSWSTLFGDVQPPTVLAKDPDGTVHQLVDVKAAVAVLQKAGKLAGRASNRSSGSAKGVETRHKNDAARAKVKAAIETSVCEALSSDARAADQTRRLRAIILSIDFPIWGAAEKWIKTRHRLTGKGGYGSVLDAKDISNRGIGLLGDLLLDGVIANMVSQGGLAGKELQAFGKTIGVDVDKIIKAATEKHTPKEEPEKKPTKTAKKTPAKKGGKKRG